MPVLYRTYRPNKWSEVIGQDDVVSTLKGAIDVDRISHAYLFSGSRGTGKTSVARIFAKSIGTNQDDIYEIDAASNRGIDNIRELRDHVAVLPFSSKYKVYIIDEVHMLSKDAWNALLKTIEEPPQHVIFILATTEFDKVPETIISRCQCLSFKRPSMDVLRKQISIIAKKEGYDLDTGASELIALFGDGSFRDALGTLEKVISSSKDKKLTREEVENITGAPRVKMVNDFISMFLSKNIDDAMTVLNTVQTSSVSIDIYAMLILEKLRYIFLVQNSPTIAKTLGGKLSKDDIDFVNNHAQQKSISSDIIISFINSIEYIDRSPIKILPLELFVAMNCK